MMPRLNFAALTALALLIARKSAAQGTETYEQPPINYSATAPRDAMAEVQSRLATGQLNLNGSGREIVLRLLRELKVPVESQLLVFSKTSFQRQRIRPDHPRALYFSDNCYVGWVPSGLVEVTTIDPQLGPIFYSFDPNAEAPKFVRDNNCLSCHGGNFVRGIPGIFVRSVFTDAEGEPLLRFGSEMVDFRTPFANRWAGWYVTGKHGTALHRGNTLAQDKNGELAVDLKRGANVVELGRYFETRSYLAPGSDIVALLVFEHQLAMQNTLTRAGQDCRRMLAYQKNLQHDLNEPVTEELTYDSVKRVFAGAAKAVVDDLLFKDEALLPQGVEGAAAFQTAFRTSAPRDRQGRTLKDFQLQSHLFQNRCSYLIYSESFLTLPEGLKRQVYTRLRQALDATNSDPEYGYIGREERARISSILRETHPDFRSAIGAAGVQPGG